MDEGVDHIARMGIHRPAIVRPAGGISCRDSTATPGGCSLLPMPGTRFAGRVALITGGGDGMGRAVALRLASEGAAVALVGRTQEKLTAVADAIHSAGGRAEALAADLTSPGRPLEAVTFTMQHFGRLDVLVNAAGAPGATPI